MNVVQIEGSRCQGRGLADNVGVYLLMLEFSCKQVANGSSSLPTDSSLGSYSVC